MAFLDYLKPLGMGNKFDKSVSGFLQGSPERNEQVSRLGPEQQGLYNQLLQAGGGGSFGTAADYYRNLLSNNSEDFNAYANPELRRFREQIIPDLAEQFAGMGSGGLSSSGFRNAAVGAGTDLSERLAAIRAQLRSQAAQGLTNIGQLGLQSMYENVHRPATGGFLDYAAPIAGSALGSLLGPVGAAVGGSLGGMASNFISGKGQSSPYGNQGGLNDQLNQMVFNNNR